MSTAATDPEVPRSLTTRRAALVAAGLIVLTTALAFSNSFGGPLVFDDATSIADNPSIRRLWPIWTPLCPPNQGETVTGRPVLNLSFALNYALSGLRVTSYHVTNLAIHIAAALALFGLLRRTFLLPEMRGRASAATPLAFAISLFWAVHPLQTESVTYIAQRAESLLGLFYLLTLYCLVRGATSSRPLAWYVLCTLACLLGMATKEVMVSAPVVALLYDRTFLAGSFRGALRRRYGLYMALGATWPLLEQLIYFNWGRGNSVGFDAGVSSWSYLGMQCQAITRYLRLCIWPHPLVMDYGKIMAEGLLPLSAAMFMIVSLGLVTFVALWRSPKLGFLGICFFAVLAPTSSIVPVATQPMAEHRMYLPSAAVIATIVLGVYWALDGIRSRRRLSARAAGILGGIIVAAIAAALAATTFHRNRDYRNLLSIWTDTASKSPRSSRAHNGLGLALLADGQGDEAIAEFRTAVGLDRTDLAAVGNFIRTPARMAKLDQMIAQCRKDVLRHPESADAHCQLAWLLATCPSASRRNAREAIEHARQAERLTAGQDAKVLDALAAAHAEAGQFSEAITVARRALNLANPDKPPLARDIQARIHRYEVGKPFRSDLPQVQLGPTG